MIDFRFTDDQRLLADAVRDLLAGRCQPGDVRTAWEQGPSRERWTALAEMGVVGAAAPTEHGGSGLSDLELCLVLEEAGRAALPEPLLETAAVAVPLLVDVGGDAPGEWLPRICAGGAVASVALPGQDLVAHATQADLALVARRGELRVAPASDCDPVVQEAVDPARPLATLGRPVAGEVVATDADEAIAAATDRAALGAAAMLLGAGRRLVEEAAGYARQREQFGRPIGSFQAIKHMLADALVAIEFAAPVVYRAAYATAHAEPERSRDVSLAKVLTGEAAAQAARTALQVHGAIGYTWEHDLQLWMKKVWSLAAAYGTTDDHRARVEDAVLPGPSAQRVRGAGS